MASQPTDPRVTRMRAFLAGEHFRYRRTASTPQAGEVSLHSPVSLLIEAPDTPLMAQALADFRRFGEECLGLTFAATGTPLRLRLTGSPSAARPLLDPAAEAFTLTVGPEGVLLEAPFERGLLHGTHYLERLMADRGGPFLLPGQWEVTPQFMPRVSLGIAVDPDQEDAYLSLLSHYGMSGLRLHVDLKAVTHSSILPELNQPGREEKLAALARKLEQYARHGLDGLPIINTGVLPYDHPVFLANPARRGAPYKVFHDMATQAVLCSSNAEVLAYYEEAFGQLFRELPDLYGGVVIVGGEGFMHCYSRPYGEFEGYSSCPHCREKSPSAEVARLCNHLAASLHRVAPDKPLFAWPYSAFTWSGESDRAQQEWIAQLSPEVLVLSNFDTGSEDPQNDAGVFLYDYNIESLGPSKVFRAQAEQLHALGRPIYTKTESNVTTVAYTLPYLPVHFRWHRRFEEMREMGVAGYLNRWGFYPFNACLPEELQYHVIWNPGARAEDLLARAAVRDFGVTAAGAERVVAAWRQLSEAWDDFPYSAMTGGEREFYARGPMHYGPAHPLIFNEQDRYGLSASFFGLSGDLYSLATPEEREELLRNARPRYVCDLLLTLPYGVERYLELITRCRERWAAGLGTLREALGPEPAERARMELDVCELLEIHLTSVENVVRFYRERDELWRGHLSVTEFREVLDRLAEVLRAEIANAERALPILAREFRVRTYSVAMVEEKLRQCRFVLEQELPMFDVSVRFHVWNSFP